MSVYMHFTCERCDVNHASASVNVMAHSVHVVPLPVNCLRMLFSFQFTVYSVALSQVTRNTSDDIMTYKTCLDRNPLSLHMTYDIDLSLFLV